MCDGDDAVAVLEEVFEDGEVGLRKDLDGVGGEEGVRTWWWTWPHAWSWKL